MSSTATSITPAPVPSLEKPKRVASIDAFRGLVMLLMMAEIMEFCHTAHAFPDSTFWSFLCFHQSHVHWIGCSLHDLIQPSFSFLVGVALPYSLARRTAEGQPQWHRTLHAFWRALLLILLGVFLRSLWSDQTYWTFEDTLTQIGLGYGFLYLLGLRSLRTQWIAFAIILVGYWLAFVLYSPSSDLPKMTPEGWQYDLTGFAAHWNLNQNPAWAFDHWFLNLFPRESPFTFHEEGYATLNFIPTLATMILGLVAGQILRSESEPMAKIRRLVLFGIAFLGAGFVLGAFGICPVVKKIWTPSFVLFSGGWCFLFLAAFYLIMDIWDKRSWAFPLKVIGMNSIAAYMIAHLIVEFLHAALPRHFGHTFYTFAGPAFEPLLLGAAILLTEFLVLLWMYKRKIFLRI